MEKPDQRVFDDDLLSAEFRSGSAKGQWGIPDPEVLPENVSWPNRIFWLAAAPRNKAPDRFHVCLDLTGYRSVPPTGTFWDPSTKATLEISKRPKGKPGSRFAMVFRTDWNNGSAFYHPYDRVAAQGHTEWPKQQPHLVWTCNNTIVDYLEEFYSLLNCGDYVGV